jgi:hypothetical protein
MAGQEALGRLNVHRSESGLRQARAGMSRPEEQMGGRARDAREEHISRRRRRGGLMPAHGWIVVHVLG